MSIAIWIFSRSDISIQNTSK